MGELSKDVDDVLAMKLSIEPTGATSSSLNELLGLSEQVLSTISQTASSYAETAKQASSFRDILSQIDADKHAGDANLELSKATQRAGAETPGSQRELAFDRAGVDNSLDRRGLPNDTKTVNAVTGVGFENALAETLERENGKLVDQLSGVAARLGEDIKQATSSPQQKVRSRILDNVDYGIVERINDVVGKFNKDTNARLDKQNELSDDIAHHTRKTAAEKSRRTAENLRALGGRRTGRDFFDVIMGYSDKLDALGEIAPEVIEGAGSSISRIPGLVMAGSKLKGAAGEGAIGAKVAKTAKGAGALASRVAVPLAIGATAWTALNKGAKYYRDVGQSAKDEGYLGKSAFYKGFSNTMLDKFRGLNPFSYSTAEDFAMYRTMALNSPYHIRVGEDGYKAFTAGASSMKDMGLDPRHMIALFGKAIDEDPDFDVDSSLKELSETAKKAGLSIQEMTERTAEYNTYIQDILGIDGVEATGKAREDLAFLQGEGGIFSKGQAFGDLSEQQQMKMLTSLTSVEGSFASSQVLRRTKPEEYAEIYEEHKDPVSIMRAWYEKASPEEVASLLYDVTTKPWGNTGYINQRDDTQALNFIGSILGVHPDSVPAATLDAMREGSAGRTGDQQVLGTYEYKIEVSFDENMVGKFTSYQEAEKYFDERYQQRHQAGHLASPTGAHSYGHQANKLTPGPYTSGSSYAAGSQ